MTMSIVPPVTMPRLRLPEFGADDLTALLADVLARLDQLVANHPDRDEPQFTIPHQTSRYQHEQLEVEVGDVAEDVWQLSYRDGYHTALQVAVSRARDGDTLLWAGNYGWLGYTIGDHTPEDTPRALAVAALWLEALRYRLYHWHAA